jgi:hypothetical protein
MTQTLSSAMSRLCARAPHLYCITQARSSKIKQDQARSSKIKQDQAYYVYGTPLKQACIIQMRLDTRGVHDDLFSNHPCLPRSGSATNINPLFSCCSANRSVCLPLYRVPTTDCMHLGFSDFRRSRIRMRRERASWHEKIPVHDAQKTHSRRPNLN